MTVDRRPTALSLKFMLMMSSVPYAVGLARLPASLRNGPDIFGYAAVSALALGAIISLVGLLWRGDELNGLVLEQVGLVGIATGLMLYVVALITVAPFTWQRWADAGLAMGLCVAIATGAVWQYATIRRYRNDRWRPS